MKLTAAHFEEGAMIPNKYTCEGENSNPRLIISDVPEGVKSFVLIVDDPDATRGSTWDHWVVWNIDPAVREIPEGSVPTSSIQGRTSFGENKYGGPCPPKGSEAHRYMFKLYALDSMLNLPESNGKSDVEVAMQGHVVEEALLMGRFGR